MGVWGELLISPLIQKLIESIQRTGFMRKMEIGNIDKIYKKRRNIEPLLFIKKFVL